MTQVLVATDVPASDATVGPRLHLSGTPSLVIGGVHEPLLEHEEVVELQRAANAFAEAYTREAEAALLAAGPVGLAGLDDAGLARLVYAATKLDSLRLAGRLLTDATATSRAVGRLRPSRIAWTFAAPRRAVAIAEAAGVSELSDYARSAAPPASPSEHVVAFLKVRRLDATARLLASAARGAPRPAVAPSAVLGLFDVRNAGMVHNLEDVLSAVRSAGGSTLALACDPRIEALRASRGGGPSAALAAWVTARGLAWSTSRAATVARQVRSLAESGRVVGEGDLVSAELARSVRRRIGLQFTTTYVWQCLVDAHAIDACLAEVEPRVMVTSSDAHRYSRLMVLLARGRGVPSAVIQHGALVGESVYVPIVADLMAAWGPWCRDWFVARGTPPERVVAAGVPRAEERRQQRPSGAARRLLFPAQPVPLEVTFDLLAMAVDHLRRHPETTLRVRPHPGESRVTALRAHVSRLQEGLAARVAVGEPGRPLSEDLDWADVVLTAESTVGIDALVHGVPIVILRHPRVRSAIPFAELGAGPEAHDGETLSRAIGEVAAGACADGASSFLEAYVGDSGPEAAEDVARHVLRLAHAHGGAP